MNIAQEIYCHECRSYVQFSIDTELEGNHVLKCPKCGHEHCRVVKNGVVTEDRWDSRNNTYQVSSATVTFSSASTYSTSTSGTLSSSSTGSYFTYQNWANTTVSLN